MFHFLPIFKNSPVDSLTAVEATQNGQGSHGLIRIPRLVLNDEAFTSQTFLIFLHTGTSKVVSPLMFRGLIWYRGPDPIIGKLGQHHSHQAGVC